MTQINTEQLEQLLKHDLPRFAKDVEACAQNVAKHIKYATASKEDQDAVSALMDVDETDMSTDEADSLRHLIEVLEERISRSEELSPEWEKANEKVNEVFNALKSLAHYTRDLARTLPDKVDAANQALDNAAKQ